MKYKIIYNPSSESGNSNRKLPRIKRCLEEKKIAFEISFTSRKGEASDIAKEAVKNGFDRIIAVGGDGLIKEVVNGIAGSSAALGIIPCGTGNDSLDVIGMYGKNIEEACEVVRADHVIDIDLGKINGSFFLNNVGLAIAGEIGERKNNTGKYLSGFIAYLAASIPALFLYRAKKVRMQLDDISLHEKEMLLISIGNGRYCGGGFKLTPSADAKDGLLDICVFDRIGTFKALWHLPKTISGAHVKLPFCHMYKAKKIKVQCDLPLTAVIDGEIEKGKEFDIEVLPRGLKVIAKKA